MEQSPKPEKPLPPKSERSPENLGVVQNDASHSIIINGHKITEEELRALGSDDSDEDISQPVAVRHINTGSPAAAAMRNNSGRIVLMNGVQISDRHLSALDMQNRAPIPNGNYWYDRISGAWGYDGGPYEGFIAAGMALGGKLRPDASNGATGVFVNGRQLHRKDVAARATRSPAALQVMWRRVPEQARMECPRLKLRKLTLEWRQHHATLNGLLSARARTHVEVFEIGGCGLDRGLLFHTRAGPARLCASALGTAGLHKILQHRQQPSILCYS